MRLLKAAYLVDDKAQEEAHCKGENYWWVYIAEILERLGLTATEIIPRELSDQLAEISLLFVEDRQGTPFAHQLDAWVKAGGILVGCSPQGLDAIFGNQLVRTVSQEKGPFSLSGDFRLRPSPFTEGIACPLHPRQPLLMASPIRLVAPIHSLELGRTKDGSVITARRCGNGWAFYFGFDLAQTFWVIQQGRPVDRDYDGDGYLRAGDGIIIEDYEPEVPYTDELLFLLQNIVSVLPFPLLHQLPPFSDGSVPDALFYYGGDDEATREIDVPASKFMRSQALPYHINIMPDKNSQFAVDVKDAQEMERNGTEISLHYNFMDNFNHPSGYTQEDIERQTHLFVNEFGKVPVCANMHWCRWTGWYEPALWMKKHGLKASNCKVHRKSPPLNPVNKIGFSFGTSFPFFYWSDYTYGNKRIEFLDLPIVAYECGYKNEQTDFPKLDKVISLASYYNMAMNLFYHPVYITNYPACRSAIGKLLVMIEEKNLKILHSTPDKVTEWWLNRSQGRIENVRLEKNFLDFEASCSYPDGYIVKIPLGQKKVSYANFPYTVKKLFSQKWVFLILPKGGNKVKIGFK